MDEGRTTNTTISGDDNEQFTAISVDGNHDALRSTSNTTRTNETAKFTSDEQRHDEQRTMTNERARR
jgi:hypothetical protein